MRFQQMALLLSLRSAVVEPHCWAAFLVPFLSLLEKLNFVAFSLSMLLEVKSDDRNS